MKHQVSLLILVALVTSLILIPHKANASDVPAWADDSLIPLFLPSILSNYTTAQTIQGRVTDQSNNPIEGVVVTDDQGHAAVTDSDGNYTIEGLIPGDYTIIPSNGNYSFWPDNRSLAIPPASEGQNFFASALEGCSERLDNGGFEQDGDWEFPVTVYPADYSLNHVHGGERSVRTGISELSDNVYSYSSIRQVAIIPSNSNSVTLGFWIRPMTNEPSGKPIPLLPTGPTFGNEPLAYDAQYIIVLDQNNNLLETLIWQRTHSAGYEYHHINLKRYAGQTVKIEFGTYNDGYDGITTMYVDDVSLIACDTAVPTSTPTAGPSPTPTSTPGDCANLIDNSSFETKDSW